MANNYREIMESIDAILDDETEVDRDEESLSPQELLKDIVGCLRHCIDKMSSEEVDDYEDFVEKLKKVRDILQQDDYNDEHQLDDNEELVEESPFPEIKGDEYGTAGMGPRIDKSGKQHYENPKGQSYAAKHGFVGI
ncbi:hypothetical protein SEPL_187 [Salmonella phage SE_PL]|uniref:hypothetical protein n=1 Tax=Salmonella enterica TaxID=28901 RepID=UPI000FDF9571|nr:hypothetical protein CPT_Munch_240 [Salmonella phage Munch]EAZ2023024.1 hypothetical protein [Salmonella enterica]ECV9084160.1 hypothetical protein [Salmonella enterica subsp. enterica serovar Infantis]MCP0435738.1 hypothetical protein [Salmonella enterica subsp. enterica serovar Mbandaka]QCW18927.1 hypothetical protein 7t3_0406 [Salmonella phage 7t3]QIG62800.1 hypothetical protein SEPL_187 [Salmonella phage SE_PL]WNV47346.1 hypothetical protein [Klebsiella phage fENko-Kae01]